jgi:hypothetical protein
MWLWLLAGCSSSIESDSEPSTRPWSRELPAATDVWRAQRGFQARRAILHLHSPWSHDACDGDPLPGGTPNTACLADLRAGLCDTRIDAAFVTDHPDFAAYQSYEALFHQQPGDTWYDDTHQANQIHCPNGHIVTWMPGIEDELMPAALHRQAADDPAESHRLYNQIDAEAITADNAAGATVWLAHTEQRDPALLASLQDDGLAGVELFNLHASFAPDLRSDYLGLDGTAWLGEIQPFTSPEGTAEPDLFVLAVLGEQGPSIRNWDALLARGPMSASAGTDAHQNVLPIALRDGERGDSYRRMLRWFSNVLLTTDGSPTATQAALAAGRAFVAFEVLGTPEGFDFHVDDGGTIAEMGGTATGGEIVLACPTLADVSPHGADAPEITATIFKDGAVWKTGCGRFAADGSGVYRARVDLVPHHLRPFLGDAPDAWIHAYPWVYSNAIRVVEK